MSFQNGTHGIHGVYLGYFQNSLIMNHRRFFRNVTRTYLLISRSTIYWRSIIEQLTVSFLGDTIIYRFRHSLILTVPRHQSGNCFRLLLIVFPILIWCVFISIVSLIQSVLQILLRKCLILLLQARQWLVDTLRGFQSTLVNHWIHKRAAGIGLQQTVEVQSPIGRFVDIMQFRRSLFYVRLQVRSVLGQIS